VLDRTRGARKFRRITGAALTPLLPAPAADSTPDAPSDDEPETPDSPETPVSK
jgi:proteasome alpha subunit